MTVFLSGKQEVCHIFSS